MNTLAQLPILLILVLFLSQLSLAQNVGINDDGSSPDATAILDIKSIDKGLLIPRLSTSQRTGISSPATGLLVFDADLNSFWFFDGSNWRDLAIGIPIRLSDADGDTQIQTEESTDEDIIRFDVAGQEVLRLRLNANDEAIIELLSADEGLFLGENAGQSNTAVGNIYMGKNAGASNTIGQLNVIIGYEAGPSIDGGSNNTFLGSYAGFSATSGTNNTLIGSGAGTGTSTGSNNTMIGVSAAQLNSTGANNTLLGRNAGLFNYAGNNNVYLGLDAGYGNNLNTNAFSNNTYIGYQAGRNSEGSNNVFLGYQAGRSEMGSQKLYITNTDDATPLIYGEFDNDILEFNGDVDVIGTLNNTSDARLKRDIRPLDQALSKVIQLNGYHYYWKKGLAKNQSLQSGLLAQEVQKLMPELVREDRNQHLSVNYIGLIPYLLEAIKHQEKRNKQLGSQMKQLQAENKKIRAELEEIKLLLQSQLRGAND